MESQPYQARAMITPKTLNVNDRSVEVVLSTEKAVRIFDWYRGETIDEILLSSKAQYAEKMPLLDTHSRYSVSSVIGSLRDIKSELGRITARAFFAETEEGNKSLILVRDGHLTDLSIGYSVLEAKYIEKGNSLVIDGKEFKAETRTLRVVTNFRIFEGSFCPIGANDEAKARSANFGEKNMPEEIKTVSTPVPEPKIDLESEKRAAVDIERKRVTEINSLCREFEIDPTDYISRGAAIDDVKSFILQNEAKRRKTNKPEATGSVEIVRDAVDGAREFVENSLCLRMGLELPFKKTEASHISLVDMARELFIATGRVEVRRMSKSDVARMCFRAGANSTSDFPAMMANSIGKRLGKAYAEAPSTWQIWCASVEVPDFKDIDVIRVGEGAELGLVPEGGDYPEETYGEEKESYKLSKYGKTFRLTWEALINDDLRVFDKTAKRQGYMAKRKVNVLAYAVLTGNANMSDGKALFHADHFNLKSSGGTAPSVDALNTARAAMRTQKGIDTDLPLNLEPKFMILPAALEGTGKQLVTSEYVPGTNQGHSKNIHFGTLTPVVEGLLDANDPAKWYLAADQNQADTVEVAFLEGHREPFLDELPQSKPDVREYYTRMPCAAKAIDWRGMYRNDGD